MWYRPPVKAVRGGVLDHTGFTLLEVMVAVAIVAIALVPLLRLHLVSLDATIWTQDYTTAVMLAQAKMAEVPPELEPGEEDGKFDEPAHSRFQWQMLIGEKEEIILGETAQPLEVQRIQVTITWEDGQRSRAYQLESYVVQ